MNEPYDFVDLDGRLDRLVDGELSGDEYRELLARLEDEEDGWRRCAMAFLEAQAWSGELGAVRETVNPPASTERPAVVVGRSVVFVIAIAASFLLTFGLGSQFHGWFRGGTDANLVRKPEVGTSAPQGDALADGIRPMDGNVALAGNSSADVAGGPLGRATFVMAGNDGSSKEIDVPVFPVNDAYGQAVLEDVTNVPPNIRRALRKLGYEVHRDLHWAPVELEEGGQMMVPYGQVEITPAVQRSFQ